MKHNYHQLIYEAKEREEEVIAASRAGGRLSRVNLAVLFAGRKGLIGDDNRRGRAIFVPLPEIGIRFHGSFIDRFESYQLSTNQFT
jgi:hypothetical protein